jgi:hypothetical protein
VQKNIMFIVLLECQSTKLHKKSLLLHSHDLLSAKIASVHAIRPEHNGSSITQMHNTRKFSKPDIMVPLTVCSNVYASKKAKF